MMSILLTSRRRGYPRAYHAAEPLLTSGTEGRYHMASTEGESRASRVLQDFWVEFARDPQRGLRDAGWGGVLGRESRAIRRFGC
jgi:hypothetical protein